MDREESIGKQGLMNTIRSIIADKLLWWAALVMPDEHIEKERLLKFAYNYFGREKLRYKGDSRRKNKNMV